MSIRVTLAVLVTFTLTCGPLQAAERSRRQVCAGPLCAQLHAMAPGNLGITVNVWPPNTSHVNVRCQDGTQQDTRKSYYMFCKGRTASLQHCKKGVFSSSCSPWFTFSMQGTYYNPR